ncbi:hypothetical protein PHOSAC3_120780 [Mesotoga infera]|nr:hypothetical protein PHOSAC3_120780 [Mesotoga infera]
MIASINTLQTNILVETVFARVLRITVKFEMIKLDYIRI